MGRVAQKRGAAGHRGQNATLAFDSQVCFNSRSPPPSAPVIRIDGCSTVTDDMPARGLWVGRNHRLQMCQEIGLCPRGSTCRSQDLSGDDIAAEDEGARSMPHILEFPPLDFARSQGSPGCLRSKACTPVNSSVLTVCSPCAARRCLLIQGTDRFHCFVPLFIDRRRSASSGSDAA